jgi:hypothetical protein
MSKCKEAYETLFAEPWMHERERSNLWQAAWNARGKVDVEICLSYQSSERFLSDYDQGIYYARNECAENIEQENEK